MQRGLGGGRKQGQHTIEQKDTRDEIQLERPQVRCRRNSGSGYTRIVTAEEARRAKNITLCRARIKGAPYATARSRLNPDRNAEWEGTKGVLHAGPSLAESAKVARIGLRRVG